MSTGYPEAFNEDAISNDEAIGASDRFVALHDGTRILFRLHDGAGHAHLVSRDRVLHFIAGQLEAGLEVRVG